MRELSLSTTEHMLARLQSGWEARRAFVRSVCPEGADALDIGCSIGEYTLPLATVAGWVNAYDANPRALDVLADEARRRQIRNVTTSAAWPEGEYDFVLMGGLVMILPPPVRRAYLRRLHDSLRPGGTAVVDFYTPAFWLRRIGQSRALGRLLLLRGLCARTFERELGGLAVVRRLDRDPLYLAARRVEGNDGFAAYLLRRPATPPPRTP